MECINAPAERRAFGAFSGLIRPWRWRSERATAVEMASRLTNGGNRGEQEGVPLLASHPQGALRRVWRGAWRACAQLGIAAHEPSASHIAQGGAALADSERRRAAACRRLLPPTPPPTLLKPGQRWLAACRTHLVLDHEDPSVADKFSVSRLRRSMHGRNRTVPSAEHGAPLVKPSRCHRPLVCRMN